MCVTVFSQNENPSNSVSKRNNIKWLFNFSFFLFGETEIPLSTKFFFFFWRDLPAKLLSPNLMYNIF